MSIDLSKAPKLSKDEWLLWVPKAVLFLLPGFGKLANVLKTGVAYSIPDVLPADYTPVYVAGQAPLSIRELKSLKTKKYENWLKRVSELDDKKPAFYAALFSMNDERCLQILAAHADFEDINNEQDPNRMALLMRSLLGHGGQSEQQQRDSKLAAQAKFNAFRQPSEMPIAVFKRSYDEMRRECVVLGNSLPDPADDADNFLSKLDHGRFGEMLITLANQSSLGNPKPATVDKAYELASNWKRKCDPQPSASSKSSDGGGVSIDHTVMLATTDMSGYADEYRPPKIANRGGGERAHGNRFGGRSSGGGGSRFGGRGGRPGARGDRGWGRGSGRSSDVPHGEAATTASPVKEATRREDTFTGRGQGIRGGSPGRGRGGAGRGGSGQATSGGGGGGRASPGDQLSKTCYRCGVAGHIRSDCPQKLQSILAYEQEADLHFDYAFRVDHSINADESRVSNFFCSDELLLDNQGAMSIAGNSGIVTDVRPLLKPYSLGGINSSQDRLRVVWGGGNYPTLIGSKWGCMKGRRQTSCPWRLLWIPTILCLTTLH